MALITAAALAPPASAAEPSSSKLAAAEPSTAEPSTAEPSTAEPSTAEQGGGPGGMHQLTVPQTAAARSHDASGSTRASRLVAALPATDTTDYSMVGVTWDRAALDTTPQVEVRTQHDDGWTNWTRLAITPGHGPTGEAAARTRAGTAPLWVGESTGVQVRVFSTGQAVPEDVKVVLIDPGQPQQLQPMRNRLSPIPRIITRDEWGADPSYTEPCWDPKYGDTVKAVFVHHTAGTNSYQAWESDNIVRGIYRYHTQARGWCDIGYNFLISRYGQIYEGRRGGYRKPVRGAHAGDVNAGSVGVALMGNFQTGWPTNDMKRVLVNLTAWELEGHYRHPFGHTRLAGDRYDVISGHRDAMATLCPGDHVYQWLPTLRQRVKRRIGAWRSPIYRKWQRLGGEDGWVGAPFIGEFRVHNGRMTVFDHARVYWNRRAGAHEVHGPILGAYHFHDGVNGRMGYPITDVQSGVAGQRHAKRATFQHGRVYWHKSAGAHALYGPIRGAYHANGEAAGHLGFPTTGIRSIAGGLRARLQHGIIYWHKHAGSHALWGPIRGTHGFYGGVQGRLGFPTSGIHAVAGGTRAVFQGGRVYWHRGSGAHALYGHVLRAYRRHGEARGRLGFPTTGIHDVRHGRRADFQNGWIRWNPKTGRTIVRVGGRT